MEVEYELINLNNLRPNNFYLCLQRNVTLGALKEHYHEILLSNDWNSGDAIMCKLDFNIRKEFCEYFFKNNTVTIHHPDGCIEYFDLGRTSS